MYYISSPEATTPTATAMTWNYAYNMNGSLSPQPIRMGVYTIPCGGTYARVMNQKQYELKDHLGNVRVTFSDLKQPQDCDLLADGYVVTAMSVNNYYSFGMLQPGRNWNAGNYRFGFNGKENDNEVKGVGNSVDFGARIYDSRLGRWLSCDPKGVKYPAWSPYHFGYCNPIIVIDPNGEENIVVIGSSKNNQDASWVKRPSLLAAGFREAQRLSKTQTDGNETTTIVVLTKYYTQQELNVIRNKVMNSSGIELVEVSSYEQAVMYINTKTTDSDRIKKADYSVSESRINDQITDFSYVGHGGAVLDFDPGPGGSFNESTPIKKEAFSPCSEATLLACYSGKDDEMEDAEQPTSEYWALKYIGRSVTGYSGLVTIFGDGTYKGVPYKVEGYNYEGCSESESAPQRMKPIEASEIPTTN